MQNFGPIATRTPPASASYRDNSPSQTKVMSCVNARIACALRIALPVQREQPFIMCGVVMAKAIDQAPVRRGAIQCVKKLFNRMGID